MKRKIAVAGAVFSGLYLLTIGPLLDPIPLIDEGLMILVFAKSMAVLGIDVGKWLPFLGRKKRKTPTAPGRMRAAESVVDV